MSCVLGYVCLCACVSFRWELHPCLHACSHCASNLFATTSGLQRDYRDVTSFHNHITTTGMTDILVAHTVHIESIKEIFDSTLDSAMPGCWHAAHPQALPCAFAPPTERADQAVPAHDAGTALPDAHGCHTDVAQSARARHVWRGAEPHQSGGPRCALLNL